VCIVDHLMTPYPILLDRIKDEGNVAAVITQQIGRPVSASHITCCSTIEPYRGLWNSWRDGSFQLSRVASSSSTDFALTSMMLKRDYTPAFTTNMIGRNSCSPMA
jgi:hypothetical protein